MFEAKLVMTIIPLFTTLIVLGFLVLFFYSIREHVRFSNAQIKVLELEDQTRKWERHKQNQLYKMENDRLEECQHHKERLQEKYPNYQNDPIKMEEKEKEIAKFLAKGAEFEVKYKKVMFEENPHLLEFDRWLHSKGKGI